MGISHCKKGRLLDAEGEEEAEDVDLGIRTKTSNNLTNRYWEVKTLNRTNSSLISNLKFKINKETMKGADVVTAIVPREK
jgi:hypothetical protein